MADVATATLIGAMQSISANGNGTVGSLTFSQDGNGMDWQFSASNDQLLQIAQESTQTQTYTISDPDAGPSNHSNFTVSVGGPGHDTFAFTPSSAGNHVVLNFSIATDADGSYHGDTIDLSGFGSTAADALVAATTDSHGNTVINLSPGNTVTIAHVSADYIHTHNDATHPIVLVA